MAAAAVLQHTGGCLCILRVLEGALTESTQQLFEVYSAASSPWGMGVTGGIHMQLQQACNPVRVLLLGRLDEGTL